jgi:antitoxin component YwqK of YwqJK toxin-antitoxin module
MEHQARFQNSSWFILLLLLFTSCAKPGKHATAFKVISDTTIGLKAVNGTLYLNDTLFNGTVLSFFAGTADTAAIMNFKNGAEDGVWKKFFPNKMPEETRQFDAGKKIGEYLAWWPNGNKKLQYHFKEGEYEGTCYEWN